MTHVKIHEDHRMLARADLAAELHRIATQLEAGQDVSYGINGSITVPDEVERELEIEQTKDGSGIKFGIEFKWRALAKPNPRVL